ncbi:hypothetical protein PMIN06_008970 [Paraphaeosphaeria minitans]
MAAEQDTPPASVGDVITNAQDHEEPLKGTKRQRTSTEASKNATGIATPRSTPLEKRRRKELVSAAEDAAVKEAESHKQKVQEAEKVRDAAEKKRKEEEIVAKQKEKEAKKARKVANKKRQAKEKAAMKATKDREREEKKKKADAEKTKKQEEKERKAHRKKQWEDYCTTHNFTGATLAEEPGKPITQSDAGQYYTLKPNELACLPHHPRKNTLCKFARIRSEHLCCYACLNDSDMVPYFNWKPFVFDCFTDFASHLSDMNITKLFDEDEVRPLAYRKYAILGGVPQSPESAMLAEGKKLWDDE